MYVTCDARESFDVRKRADDILICVINTTISIENIQWEFLY